MMIQMPTEYRILRDGKTYGPYTEAELREYYAAGNVVAKDLVRTPEMMDWKPLRKVLPKLKKAEVKKQEKARDNGLDPAGLRADLPSPPDIPWWLALLLEGLTSLTFFVAWDIVEAVWLRRVQRHSRALIYCGIAGGLLLVEAPHIYSSMSHGFFRGVWGQTVFSSAILIGVLILRMMGRFSMRNSLIEHFNQREPIGLRLSWWMTLIFGGLYFQFHFNRINEMKRQLATRAGQSYSTH